MKSVKQLLDEANAVITTYSVEDTADKLAKGEVVLVDVREAAELDAGGKLPGAVHIPRGMLEFIANPESEGQHEVFKTDKQIVLYCSAGGRSVLGAKTLKDMGIENVAHLGPGSDGWIAAGQPTEPRDA